MQRHIRTVGLRGRAGLGPQDEVLEEGLHVPAELLELVLRHAEVRHDGGPVWCGGGDRMDEMDVTGPTYLPTYPLTPRPYASLQNHAPVGQHELRVGLDLPQVLGELP